MASTRRQLAKAATRAKVLSAARTCFDAHGYEASSMREIAAWAHVSTGSIFANFSGKAELHREIYGEPPISPEKARVMLGALKRNRAALDLIDPMRPLQYATSMDLMRKDMDAAIALATPAPATAQTEAA